MTILTVQRIVPQGLIACQVSTSTPEDIIVLSQALKDYGWAFQINLVIGRITITSPAGVSQYADGGDWILVSDATVTYTDGVVSGYTTTGYSEVRIYSAQYPAQVGSPVEFVNQFTSDTPVMPLVWAATNETTHPAAAAQPDGTVILSFTQPTSANGPFTYVVTQTDIHDNTSAVSTQVATPTVDADGNVAVHVANDFVDGDGYTFTVTVTTPYQDVTATSATSNQIVPTVPVSLGQLSAIHQGVEPKARVESRENPPAK